MNAFRGEIQTPENLLNQIFNSVKDKFVAIHNMDTKKFKRGLYGVRTLFKAITGHLDAFYGEHFTNSINWLNQGQFQIERS